MRRFSKRPETLIVVFATCLALPLESSALELTVVENVLGGDDSVGFYMSQLVPPRLDEVVSPSGDVFNDLQVVNTLLTDFDSVAEAAEYITGTWRAFVPGFLPLEPRQELEFTIDGNFLEKINRTPPSLLTPSPADEFKNGSVIDLSWDYPGAEDIDASILRIVPQSDQTNSFSLSILDKPSIRPNQSGGSSGVEPAKFEHRISSVPGAVDNRFELSLLASEELLPLDVELTLGSHLSLTESLAAPIELALFSRFSYSRENEPFTITLTPGTCDFDGDGECDFFDLDELLYSEVFDAKYDLDGSGTIDQDDRNAFLIESGRLPADFNGDGIVDTSDLNTIGDKWLQEGQTSYAQGDSNGDGIIDALDLNFVGENWQASLANAASAPVPEPKGLALALAALFGLLIKRNTVAATAA